MSILASVLALSPTLCWELSEPGGPTAFDSTGNGHSGVYGGTTTFFNQPGPEVGTVCALFTGTGGVDLGAAVTPVANTPWTMHAWIATRTLNTVHAFIVSNTVTGSNGETIAWAAGPQYDSQIETIQQNIRILGTGVNITDGNWHQLVWTHDAANVGALYIDGLNQYTQVGLTVNVPVTSKFVAGLRVGTSAMQEYCVALWPTVLSAAQVNSLFASVSGPLQQPANLNTVSGVDLSSMLADLDAILQAVRHTY